MIPIIDMHCDTISEIWKKGQEGAELHLNDNCLSVDLEKMKKGGYLCQNFALYTNMEQVRKDGERAFDNCYVFDTLILSSSKMG